MPPPLTENQKDAAREVIYLATRFSLAGFAVAVVLLGWSFGNLRADEYDTFTQYGFGVAFFLIAISTAMAGAAIYCIFRIWRSK